MTSVSSSTDGPTPPNATQPDHHEGAFVYKVDGKLIIHDPVAVSVGRTIEKINCKNTFEINKDRVLHFKMRAVERGFSLAEMVIVILNVDDSNGAYIADILMPGHDWQQYRDRGEVPFARGLASRPLLKEILEQFDTEAAKELEDETYRAVVVVDHGVAEVFIA